VPLRVAVVGAAGFFGSALCEVLADGGETVTAVTRETYAVDRAREYDVLVNAAMPSDRLRAEQHPEQDFIEAVQKTSNLINGWKFHRFIQISSLSARCERRSVYGRHRAAAELLCDRPDALTIRLASLYGAGMTKSAIIDIKNGGPVNVDGASRYAFTHVFYAAGWVTGVIRERPDRVGIWEVGAKNSLALNDLARHMNKPVQFSGPVELQEVENPDRTFPDAREVLSFVSTMRR